MNWPQKRIVEPSLIGGTSLPVATVQIFFSILNSYLAFFLSLKNEFVLVLSDLIRLSSYRRYMNINCFLISQICLPEPYEASSKRISSDLRACSEWILRCLRLKWNFLAERIPFGIFTDRVLILFWPELYTNVLFRPLRTDVQTILLLLDTWIGFLTAETSGKLACFKMPPSFSASGSERAH